MTVFSRLVLEELQYRMVTALPVQHHRYFMALFLDDDFHAEACAVCATSIAESFRDVATTQDDPPQVEVVHHVYFGSWAPDVFLGASSVLPRSRCDVAQFRSTGS